MPIFKKSATGVGPLMPEAYANERELETALVEMPNLLAEIDGPSLAYVARQVNLEGAGILDILLVDSEGTPVVVEVKLARNGESRREVVGQVIDYVSTLTSMTVDELDRAVGGAVENALRSFAATENQDQEFETLWASIGTNLRAGMARFVIAMDAAPPELQRIVRFLASRSRSRRQKANNSLQFRGCSIHRDNEPGHPRPQVCAYAGPQCLELLILILSCCERAECIFDRTANGTIQLVNSH